MASGTIENPSIYIIRTITSETVNIAGNANSWVSSTPPTVSGYKPVAVAGWQGRSTNASLSLYAVRFDSDGKVNFALHNLTNSQATGCYAEAEVLYLKE